MDTTQYIVAIEIGSSKTVGAVAEKRSNGQLVVVGIESEPTLNFVRYGCIQNVESTKASINRILLKLSNRIDGDISSVYVGVSGRSIHSMPTEVQHSLNTEQAITQSLLDNIKSDATRNSLNNYDTIDVIPRSYTIDKIEIRNPVGSFGTDIKARLNLIVAKPSILINLKRVFNQQTQIKGLITTAVAVADAVLTADERSLGCMLVDMGAETTTVSIYRNDALVYLVTIPLGGRNLTRDITALGIREENAEKIKRNLANPLKPAADPVTIDNIRSSDASNYILARTGEIIANITAQVSNAGMSLNDIHSIVLVGGGAMLKGLDQEISDSVNISSNSISVRIASSIPSQLTTATTIPNIVENIGVMALLIAGSKQIGYDSCVVKRVYAPAPPVQEADLQIVTERPKEETTKQKKPSLLQRFRDRVVRALDESDNENDNYSS